MSTPTTRNDEQAWTIRDEIIERYIVIEGGKVNIKDDLGGETHVGGLLQATLDENKDLWEQYGYDGEGDPSLDLTKAIFIRNYWDKCWLDHVALVNADLAETIYGWALNSGCTKPVKVFQTHLNVMNMKGTRYDNIVADGFMGKGTMVAFFAYLDTCSTRKPIAKLCESVLSSQWTHYLTISAERSGERNETFTDGWFNRAMAKRERLALV